MCKIRVTHTNTHNLKISHSIIDSFYSSLFTDLNKLLMQKKDAKRKNYCVFFLFNFPRNNQNFIMCPGNSTQGRPQTFFQGGGQLWDDGKEKYTPLAFLTHFIMLI